MMRAGFSFILRLTKGNKFMKIFTALLTILPTLAMAEINLGTSVSFYKESGQSKQSKACQEGAMINLVSPTEIEFRRGMRGGCSLEHLPKQFWLAHAEPIRCGIRHSFFDKKSFEQIITAGCQDGSDLLVVDGRGMKTNWYSAPVFVTYRNPQFKKSIKYFSAKDLK